MNNINNHFFVEEATVEDIPGIYAVIEENLLSKKEKSDIKELEKNGFVVIRYEEEDLNKWIIDKENNIVLICKEGEEIIGYIIGCDMNILPAEMQDQFLKIQCLKNSLNNHEILYHKQIAVKKNKKGAGYKLLQEFLKIALMKKYQQVACAIIHEPILNKISINFHQKHGFKYIDIIQIENNRAGVYLKKLINI